MLFGARDGSDVESVRNFSDRSERRVPGPSSDLSALKFAKGTSERHLGSEQDTYD